MQYIPRMVPESKTLTILKNFDKTRKRLLKARVLDVYKNQYYIDCYNFIQ